MTSLRDTTISCMYSAITGDRKFRVFGVRFQQGHCLYSCSPPVVGALEEQRYSHNGLEAHNAQDRV